MDWITTVTRSSPSIEADLVQSKGFSPAGKAPATQKTVGNEFEAFVLQSFIKQMLPKNAESVFGDGLSGDVYKSMMANALGGSLAQRSSIGIAEHIDRAVGLRSDTKR
ncbi:MAG: rod-binding protein [Hyphomicrobiaceae bacterium]